MHQGRRASGAGYNMLPPTPWKSGEYEFSTPHHPFVYLSGAFVDYFASPG